MQTSKRRPDTRIDMKKYDSRLDIRISVQDRDALQQKVTDIGYKSISDLVRDFLSVIAHGEGCVPKTDNLIRLMARFAEPVTDKQTTEETRADFFAYMSGKGTPYPYNKILAKMGVDEFLAEIVSSGDSLMESAFYTDFYDHYHYGLWPAQVPLLLRAYLADPDTQRQLRQYATDTAAMAAAEKHRQETKA